MTSPLIVDVYAYDLKGKPNWQALIDAGPPWHGAILKATEGISTQAEWAKYSAEWFDRNWPAVRQLAGDRYGRDFWRGAYHYLIAYRDGRAQAEHYLRTIERAGGWGAGDLWPIVDVEEGSGNSACSRDQVEDTTRAFVEKIKSETGREAILYAGWWLASLGVRDRMGCSWLWYASYTPTLNRKVYERIGWSLDRLWAWQYCGDGEGYLKGYPTRSPLGPTDISAVTIAGGGDSLAWMRSGLGTPSGTSTSSSPLPLPIRGCGVTSAD